MVYIYIYTHIPIYSFDRIELMLIVHRSCFTACLYRTAKTVYTSRCVRVILAQGPC